MKKKKYNVSSAQSYEASKCRIFFLNASDCRRGYTMLNFTIIYCIYLRNNVDIDINHSVSLFIS